MGTFFSWLLVFILACFVIAGIVSFLSTYDPDDTTSPERYKGTIISRSTGRLFMLLNILLCFTTYIYGYFMDLKVDLSFLIVAFSIAPFLRGLVMAALSDVQMFGTYFGLIVVLGNFLSQLGILFMPVFWAFIIYTQGMRW